MYVFKYIMFIIIMVMPCGILSYITCIIYLLCEILVVCGIKCISFFLIIVCVIRIVITCLVWCNTVIEVIRSSFYTAYLIRLIAISNIITMVIDVLSYVICVFECSVIVFLI